jgi:hypothetical protein
MLITYQKSKSGFKNFDAAIGYWMQKPVFIDIIRVYGKKLQIGMLHTIRKEFLENLQMLNERKVLI